ncbi:AraC family transcriptional regulator [Hoeflea sp. AS60]|uniref:AraC family transcriptional regulator n=1 Tax=Hoeflea sp. AS60 TaxID=3135780 RepID=UPI00316F72C0
MPKVDKLTVQLSSGRAVVNEFTKLFGQLEVDQIEDKEPFDLSGEVTTVLNMRIWRTVSQSGYKTSYSNPAGQDFELHFIQSGRYRFRAGGSEIDAAANSAVLLKDTSKVEVTACPGSEKLAVLVPLSRFSHVLGNELGAPGQRLANFRSHIEIGVEGIDLIRNMANLLIGDPGAAHPFSRAPNGALLLGDALVASFVGFWPKIDNSATETTSLPRHLQRAIEWMDAHAAENISIEQLARQCGASIRTLQNSFRQHLSTSPNAYIQRIRLSRIHQELLCGDRGITIEQIAARWGFGHMGYFAARYRTLYGESPSVTRQKWKKGRD